MITVSRLAMLLMLPLTLASLPFGQDPAFLPLFDGAELTGWRYGKEALHRVNETPDKRFSVKDGTIVLATKDKDGKKDVRELISVREFARDFVLKLEFKAANE